MILVIMVLGLPIRNTIAKYFENSKNIVLLVHDNYILNKDESILNKIKDLLKK